MVRYPHSLEISIGVFVSAVKPPKSQAMSTIQQLNGLKFTPDRMSICVIGYLQGNPATYSSDIFATPELRPEPALGLHGEIN